MIDRDLSPGELSAIHDIPLQFIRAVLDLKIEAEITGPQSCIAAPPAPRSTGHLQRPTRKDRNTVPRPPAHEVPNSGRMIKAARKVLVPAIPLTGDGKIRACDAQRILETWRQYSMRSAA